MTTSNHANNYQRKIKSREELAQIIGSRPRARTVIMCHGAFDLVHPGHVSHLMYAKARADILVASLTCDTHLTKANYRPFVPQNLRAMNLAALEVVDYVIIDEQPTPIENIHLLQPDLFAKGYDYSSNNLQPGTQAEMEAVGEYGGELIFTPGDVVYSSSAIIEDMPPDISSEKLATLMASEEVTFDSLKAALDSFRGVRVHVLGDTIVDSYTHCSVIGTSTSKTPTISSKFEREVNYVGGAAVVAKHLRLAGADVNFSTVLGNDQFGDFVLGELKLVGINCHAFIDPTRVTTQKNVFISGSHRLLKVDKVDNRPISQRTMEELQSSLSTNSVDGFIFSDFRHGIFNPLSIPEFIEGLPSGPMRVADSQVASRWGNILDFQGFDLITPNEREARFALGDQDSVVRPLSFDLYKKANCKTLILKLGDRGILTYRAPTENMRAFFSIDSFARNVVDPVGAGDAMLAYATLAQIATKSEVVASILGSMASAVACEREGNVPVSPEDVLRKLEAAEKRTKHL